MHAADVHSRSTPLLESTATTTSSSPVSASPNVSRSLAKLAALNVPCSSSICQQMAEAPAHNDGSMHVNPAPAWWRRRKHAQQFSSACKQAAHHVQAVAADGKCKMLQRCWPVVSIYHMAGRLMQLRHPARELRSVGQRCRQKHLPGQSRQSCSAPSIAHVGNTRAHSRVGSALRHCCVEEHVTHVHQIQSMVCQMPQRHT